MPAQGWSQKEIGGKGLFFQITPIPGKEIAEAFLPFAPGLSNTSPASLTWDVLEI